MSLKHDNYIKDRKNVTIFLGEEIKMQLSSIPAGTIQRSAAIKIQAMFRGQRNKQLRNKQLLDAAKIGDIERTENLIKHGADINTTDRHGYTALHWAAIYGELKIANLLINKGADINAIDSNRRTALHLAATFGHVKIVEALVKAEADVSPTDHHGYTALDVAAIDGSEDIVQALVIAGADLTDNDLLTVLELAKNNDCYDDVKKAIEEGKTQLIKLVKEMPTKIEETLKSLDKLPNLPSEIIKTIVDGYFNPEQIKQAEKYIEEREAAAATKIQAMARGNLVR